LFAVIAVIVGAFMAGRYLFPDAEAERRQGYAAGRAMGVALGDDLVETTRREDADQAARYAALVLDLWQTFSGMSVPIEGASAFLGGVPAAGESLRDDIATVERLTDEIRSLDITGGRFDVQSRVYREGARACLDIARSAASALEEGNQEGAEALLEPLTRCYVGWKNRGARVAYR
jgi:hypothetical protein